MVSVSSLTPTAATVRAGSAAVGGEVALTNKAPRGIQLPGEKQAKHLNRLFLTEDMQIANKPSERSLASAVHGRQIKTEVSYCLTPSRVATVAEQAEPQVLEAVWKN